MKWILPFLLCLPVYGANWYIATNGTAGGGGSFSTPWDMATGLADNSNAGNANHVVHAGDTIWLRGGTYAGGAGGFISNLVGANGNPIVVRGYPGERPIIDGATHVGLTINGGFTYYRNFEIFNSSTDRSSNRGNGIDTFGTNCGVINMIIHDAGDGIGIWETATNSFIYGCVSYNNGWQAADPDRGHGHGIYAQNNFGGNQTIANNITCNQFGNGIQAYGQAGSIQNITVQSNIAFANGSLQRSANLSENYALGGNVPFFHLVVGSDIGYHYFPAPADVENNLRVGFDPTTKDSDATITNNYIVGGIYKLYNVTNVICTNNTIVPNPPTAGGVLANYANGVVPFTWTWDLNTYFDTNSQPFSTNFVVKDFPTWKTQTGNDTHSTLTSANPAANVIYVLNNAYEANRANVAIFNWQNQDNVSVDISSVIMVGTPITVVNAANYYGTPVLQTNYAGGTIILPMTNLVPAICVGSNVPPPATGPLFNAFVVMGPASVSGQTNFAASCSQTDVQAAINASGPGATVVVPDGECAITTHMNFALPMTVISQHGPTFTKWDDSVVGSDATSGSILSEDSSGISVFRISGFGINPGSRVGQFFEAGTLRINGQGTQCRIDNCIFQQNNNIGIAVNNNPFGVIDHNLFNTTAFVQPMKGNSDIGDNGDYAWTNGNFYGQSNKMYIENNTFINGSGAPGLGIDGFGGWKYVIRSNYFDRMIIGGHGTETTGRERGVRNKEVYWNIFTNHNDSEIGHFRSGGGIVTSNVIVNSFSSFTIRDYRMTSPTTPWRYADGTNTWDVNDGVVYQTGQATAGSLGSFTDSTKTWTPHQWIGYSIRDVTQAKASIVSDNTANTLTYSTASASDNGITFAIGDFYDIRKVVHVLDSAGRGQGNLINTASPAWPNEALDTIYNWSNTYVNVTSPLINNGGYYPVLVDVASAEVSNAPPAIGIWTPFVYPHPLVSASSVPPAPPPPPGPVGSFKITGNMKVTGNLIVH